MARTKKTNSKSSSRINSKSSILSISVKNNNKNSNNSKKSNSGSFVIRYSSHRFLTRVKTARHVKRDPLVKDKFAEFLDDNFNKLKSGEVLEKHVLDTHIFNHSPDKCICQNVFKLHLNEDCGCSKMTTYSSQGKSGAAIHSITCANQQKQILKVVPLDNYYIKLRTATKNYSFLELDGFSIQTLINTYIHKLLPHNCVNIINSGVCVKGKIINSYNGYNLMEEANMGSGADFIEKLLNKVLDIELDIDDEDRRYVAFINFLLQTVLIIGHLQSSHLEFFHGDYKPENVFVKKLNKMAVPVFEFNVFGKVVKVKNMGFAVLIADFDRSSITVPSEQVTGRNYRIISPVMFGSLLSGYVSNTIKKYGDIDPDDYEGNIKFEKPGISSIIPKTIDPSITIMRSAGVKLFRDFDLYTFFIKLISNQKIRDYIISRRINDTLMSFMSKKFKTELMKTFKSGSNIISVNEAVYIAINIFGKIKEPIYPVFTEKYIDSLKVLNYKLFRNY